MLVCLQAPRASCATRATALCVSTQHGASLRVLTTASGDGSVVTLLCPRYVASNLLFWDIWTSGRPRRQEMDEEERGRTQERTTGSLGRACSHGRNAFSARQGLWLTCSHFLILDRLWLQQEDPPHDPLGPQGLPCQQRQGRRAPPYAQQDLRRRVRSPTS